MEKPFSRKKTRISKYFSGILEVYSTQAEADAGERLDAYHYPDTQG